MTWIDHCRRAATVVLVVLAMLAVPAIANAKFSANRTSGLATGTDQMETPSGITGTYRCTRSGSTESVSVTITGFTDTGPTGSSYGMGLALGTTVKDSTFGTSKTATLDGSRTYDNTSTTWTIGVQGYLSRWTSDIGTDSVICPASGIKTGSF
jgi:hypothetical protein